MITKILPFLALPLSGCAAATTAAARAYAALAANREWQRDSYQVKCTSLALDDFLLRVRIQKLERERLTNCSQNATLNYTTEER